ncbi:LuxR C-terminal-related transcriptional regulator [Arthrobacter sp. CG_A4]|uniref:LuxR C-terminal-related transcriptional regulator n=1 Tax=Arthrobacter sp. CG_A4 TaxID=3071706 RepID=UPI002E015CB7|nr:LuxR family maltose regulon positive regulatory protein [Arthrobacter sp. CG_A4]
MAMPIVATKLFVPSPRAQAVPRLRLVEQLDEGVRAGRKLTLISAPAGFGKTTLVSEWIAETRRRKPEARVAWLSLDERDNFPVSFLSYLTAAFHQADPDIDSTGHNSQLSVDATMTSLVNEVARSRHEIILVLDDFQLIEEPSIRDAVAFLIDHLPPTLHVMISSRSDPLLPLARLRARGELTELRAADLRFTPDEAATFLNQAMGLSLSPEDVTALERRTEGWIAGLQLAALSMRESTDISGFITAFTGSNRYVIDYLIEEVLERAPLDVREFLSQTALLDRLCGPLCDAVTGENGGSEMLASIERANLFLVPLDDERRWYRYHHLFADVLRARLIKDGTDHISELNSRASDWFERNDLAEEAIKYAFAASDFPRAAKVLEATIPSVRKSRQDAMLRSWLAKFPSDVIDQRPVLRVFSAWSSIAAGDIAAVEPQLREAERLLSATTETGMPAHGSEPGEELRSLPVTIALYRASVALAQEDLAGVREHAQRAADIALPDDYFGRGAAAGLLGLAFWASGDLEAGVRSFGVCKTSLALAGNLTDALSTTMVIADMLMPLGRLREAHHAYDEALHEAIERGNGGHPTADLHCGMSEMLRERNLLAGAREHLDAASDLGEGAFSHEHHYRWFVGMARVREAEGELDVAFDLLTEAEQHYRRGFFADARPIGGMKARVRIAQGRLDDAQAWVREQGLTAVDEPSYLREFGHVTLARLMIVKDAVDPQSGSIHEVDGLLARLLDAAEAGGRLGSVNEILVLQALALEAHDQLSRALVPLERALEQAEPEGYFRLFLDEGPAMLRLLRAAAGAGVRPDYVRQLNQALRQTEGTGRPGLPLPEMLSERELHVLRLLATELTGPEIARELYVSLNTMRTHTKHIFLKLDVTSRPAAVRRAEALGLI